MRNGSERMDFADGRVRVMDIKMREWRVARASREAFSGESQRQPIDMSASISDQQEETYVYHPLPRASKRLSIFSRSSKARMDQSSNHMDSPGIVQ